MDGTLGRDRRKPSNHKTGGIRTESQQLEAYGIHCFADLYDCPGELLNDKDYVTQAVRDAVKQGMATLIGEVSHSFHPQGVTALALIAESHVAVHTWPECGYAAADVFTCGDQASAERACEYLISALQAKRHVLKKIERGMHVGMPESQVTLDGAAVALSGSP